MIINSWNDLNICLSADSKNYQQLFKRGFSYGKMRLGADPNSDQTCIWKYIKTLRMVEFYSQKKSASIFYRIVYYFYLHRLRKFSRITGFQIPPNICGKRFDNMALGTNNYKFQSKIG